MNFIYFLLLSYFIIQLYKLVLIINDPKVAKYSESIYKKKSKSLIHRNSIYDKNKNLLQYSKIEKDLEKRYYLLTESLSSLGIVGSESNGLSGLEASQNNYLNKSINKFFLPRLTAKEKFYGYFESQYFSENNKIITNLEIQLSIFTSLALKETIIKNGSEFGMVIIMDGESGAIETMIQFPQYDPTTISSTIPIDYLYPLGITQAYEMGSIMKPFLMLAAFDAKIIKSSDLINCFNTKEKKFLKNRIITTWKAHGLISFKEVIQGSNNIGVAQVGLQLGKKLYDIYKKCGFGDKTNIEIKGEHKGILHHPDKWTKETIISVTFGYELAITLLQGVAAWSLFTNSAKRLTPRLLKNSPIKETDQFFSKEVINESKDILLLDQIKMKNFGLSEKLQSNLYGKTGTANILINNKYNKELNRYSFLGHIEKNNKKKIIGIYIEGSNNHKQYASDIALPLFLKIATYLDKKL